MFVADEGMDDRRKKQSRRFEERDRQIIELANQGLKDHEIAERVGGLSTSHVGVIICNARKRGEFVIARQRGRKHSRANTYFGIEAGKRGLTSSELIRKLIEVIERDKIVGAILDDATKV